MTTHTAPAEQDLDPVFFLADTDPEAMNAMNAELVAAFRACHGKLDGAFEGVPLLLLTTTGARSSTARTTPVNYTRAGEGYVAVASKSGAQSHPAWYHNLLAHPDATIEVQGAALPVRGRIATGTERDELFDRHAAALPNFIAYKSRTTRRLPVVVLETSG